MLTKVLADSLGIPLIMMNEFLRSRGYLFIFLFPENLHKKFFSYFFFFFPCEFICKPFQGSFSCVTVLFPFSPSSGGTSKTLMILNVCPNALNLKETLSSLNFGSRSRNAVLSLGNRDTIKKWRDIVSCLFLSFRCKQISNNCSITFAQMTCENGSGLKWALSSH